MSEAAFEPKPDGELRSLIRSLLAEAPQELGLEGKLDPRHLEAALVEPAHDILRRDGKRFRSRLLEHCWTLAGGLPGAHPKELPLVVELLHAGSLVIDDIEDDSHERRGEPALHRKFGVPLALNTGNWLYFLPVALLSRLDFDDSLKLSLQGDLSEAVILCHQGQALDLSARVTTVSKNEMPELVRHASQLKTGSLMRLSALLGARAAHASPATRHALARFGAELGVGLQMLDDWSGIAVDERRQKGIEDIKLKRPTWPWAWLALLCDELSFAKLVDDARRVSIDWEAEGLILRLRSQLEDRVPEMIGTHLRQAFDSLTTVLGPSSTLEELGDEIRRLEEAFG